jgi:phage recombination protein Bet
MTSLEQQRGIDKKFMAEQTKEKGLTLGQIGKEFKMSAEQMKVITTLIAPKATLDELRLFMYVAKRTGLDPFSKQIYFVKRHDNKTNTDKMTIQTGIDGFRAVAGRNKDYAGMDDVVYDIDEAGKQPGKASVTVYKMVGNNKISFTATARWTEYFPGDFLGFMWKTKPYLMLGKCAEALALRKAFPMDLSGVYVEEEMAQAEAREIAPLSKNRDVVEAAINIAETMKDTSMLDKLFENMTNNNFTTEEVALVQEVLDRRFPKKNVESTEIKDAEVTEDATIEEPTKKAKK